MTVKLDETTRRITEILVRYIGAERPADDVDPSTPVFGPSGIITDSLRVLDALCSIEAELDVSIPDEDLTEELFESVRSLAAYVDARLASAEPA